MIHVSRLKYDKPVLETFIALRKKHHEGIMALNYEGADQNLHVSTHNLDAKNRKGDVLIEKFEKLIKHKQSSSSQNHSGNRLNQRRISLSEKSSYLF